MNTTAITVDSAAGVTAAVAGFRRGERPLAGLELYYELERATPLLEFHTMLREGPRNRDANGLQQSYGDHNRLLMLGLDRLVGGDLAWLRSRVDQGVTDADLRELLDAVAALDLSRDALVALWLAAALHDCGMLCGRGAYVDVEDGIVISRDVIEELCPEPLRGLSYFALHHHDYIKDVFLGEVPATIVANELELLDPSLRRTALAALGLVQIAGAASLGTGRLMRSESRSSGVASTAVRSTTPRAALAPHVCCRRHPLCSSTTPAPRPTRHSPCSMPPRVVGSSDFSTPRRCTAGTARSSKLRPWTGSNCWSPSRRARAQWTPIQSCSWPTAASMVERRTAWRPR